MGELGRQPLAIVEIDVDQCQNTYGAGACTAILGTHGIRKCFNTYATCQDRVNFDRGAMTLRFARNQSGLPIGETVFPALTGISTRAAELNLSGIDPRTTAMGKRERVTLTFQDFTYHDGLTDPYRNERISGAAQSSAVGYFPIEYGTFFGRLLARSPYYVGRSLRVRHGFVGDAISAMPALNYVIAELTGPNADGVVQIVAKDILDLADNEKAVCPTASRGVLAAALTTSETTLTLTPAGIGAEYPSAGFACIGREVVYYTRSSDTMTIQRAQEGTTVATHAAGDLVQECAKFYPGRISDAIYNMLVVRAGIDASFIDLPAWQAENDRWLSGFSVGTIITKPTGVSGLVGELCQLGVMVWWDKAAQEIRFKANRPLDIGESAYLISDAASLITKTPNVERGDDQRISALYLYHGLMDPTQGAEQSDNFRKLVVASDPSASGANEYSQEAIKTIYSRWFGQYGDDAMALSVASRLLTRYRNPPNILSGDLDPKDTLTLGQVIEATSYLMQDDIGAPAPEQMQVNYVEESEGRIKFRAETYAFSARYGFITEASRADYGASSAAEKALGTYIVAASSLLFADGSGPYVMF